ncbi:ABC transporter substrate-binding protein [Methylobacterium pseudosasicola]|uniref:Amino acid ABC transporter substrate-binding protein, PAAT family n=1 Tax=Methylobacterium pseudosasicola TaxID=582667 RepID=A0A1I4Q6H7_9HYPH|nr:ABC transporter substrate-binding protein [Methylobacterium pseudosasicola]SFM35654.1 amino acid ABC transporter substrate-binding protein, PAAT family [Methylobacterium pseudosasicola]
MLTRRRSLALLAAATSGALVSGRALALEAFDFSPEQPGRVRAARDEEAIRLIAKDARFAQDGVFTVANNGGRFPFGGYATDTKTIIGSEPDIAQLVADALGRKLEIVPVSWSDWPLGVVSGKYDAVISNVTVTEQRKEKFDFSTYRKDLLGFYVRKDNPIVIREPRDVAGLRVIVSAGTNQEQILLRWNDQNVKAGLKPVEFQYHDDDVALYLSIESGRADAYLGPNALLGFKAAQEGKTRLAGNFSGGWPVLAEIAVTTRKGAGLAEAITHALNTQIKNGHYAQALARWNLSAEAIEESRTNPPGLPRT